MMFLTTVFLFMVSISCVCSVSWCFSSLKNIEEETPSVPEAGRQAGSWTAGNERILRTHLAPNQELQLKEVINKDSNCPVSL